MVTYYRVTDYPGDIYHASKDCAGDQATAIGKKEAKKSASRPCKICVPDISE